MKRMEVSEIIRRIDLTEPFEAESSRGGFRISISSYLPVIAAAIHAGSSFREELNSKVNLSAFQRWQEEDPYTDRFISGLPITITALDSRYEYDLNRAYDACIYDTAWGKRVWRQDLDLREREIALEKHREFYVVMDHLVKKLESLFKEVFIFDIHSYNYKRNDSPENLPLFNLGTYFLGDSFRDRAHLVLDKLKGIRISGITNYTGENIIFMGKGYLAQYISENFSRTAVLPIEIKKVYCNENSGIYYGSIIDSLAEKLQGLIRTFTREATVNISYHTLDNFTRRNPRGDEEIIAARIALLMQKNYRASNDGEYTSQEMDHLVSNKTTQTILERIQSSYLVYAKRGDAIIGCGIITSKGEGIEAKMLNVDLEYRGLGLAGNICDIREGFARAAGHSRLYIESLKFENTIRFHSRRGFRQVTSPRKLKYSIYMCKDL